MESTGKENPAMTATETAPRDSDTEIERIEAWRAEELKRAGYDRRATNRIATRHDVDLHIAVDLLRRGCPQHLALNILL